MLLNKSKIEAMQPSILIFTLRCRIKIRIAITPRVFCERSVLCNPCGSVDDLQHGLYLYSLFLSQLIWNLALVADGRMLIIIKPRRRMVNLEHQPDRTFRFKRVIRFRILDVQSTQRRDPAVQKIRRTKQQLSIHSKKRPSGSKNYNQMEQLSIHSKKRPSSGLKY